MIVKRFLKSKICWGVTALLAAVAALSATVTVDYHGHREGVYLLRGERTTYELTDDVMLGEEQQVICGMSWDVLRNKIGTRPAIAYGEPHLETEWFTSDGSGYVRNIYPDGKQLLTCFSRFRDTDNKVPKGLFVGGGLPYHEHSDKAITMNDTGMAYFDGKEWHHIWCNVNESIALGYSNPQIVSPSQWSFLGSRIIQNDGKRVVLKTSHAVSANGVQLHIDRYAIFRAGESYFILINKVENVGPAAGTYFYVYGDEPWVGEYGTSGGNIGWSKDRIFPYEAEIPTDKYSWAGMYDHGNGVTGEKGNFTGLANFIEWLGIKPDVAYFSNTIGTFSPESAKVPLKSSDNRVLFLQWGPRLLPPGQPDVYVFAIGMTDPAATRDVPVKPQVDLAPGEISAVLAQ